MKPIIKVQNLSKEYRIGTVQAPYETWREALSGAVRIPFGRRNKELTARHETIWALKDVNFEIKPGEVVGIVGRNGAGKSTLLKLLSRVIEPTTGRIELYGRIGSLLEVGTGFHPELTGRENVFLNGAIIGMRRAEVERKFDEIVAFSEIEKFIDTPVKWYSSGMYLRLAFSVSAHLEPEILILDEVLAVGDTGFQIKCFNKMQEIHKQGRTLLFVSHSLQAITRFCERALYLSDGKIVDDGPAKAVADNYLGTGLQTATDSTVAEQKWNDPLRAPGNEIARLRAVRVRTEDGLITNMVDIRKPVGVEMEYEVLQQGVVLVPNLHFFNQERIYLFVTADNDGEARRPRPVGRYTSTVWIPGNFLSNGPLVVTAALTTPEPTIIHFCEVEVIAFEVVDSFEGDSARGGYKDQTPGVIRPKLPWTTQFIPSPQTEECLVGEGSVV